MNFSLCAPKTTCTEKKPKDKLSAGLNRSCHRHCTEASEILWTCKKNKIKRHVISYPGSWAFSRNAYHQIYQQDWHEENKLHKNDVCQDAERKPIVQKSFQEVVLVVQLPDHHHKGLYHRKRHAFKLFLMTRTENKELRTVKPLWHPFALMIFSLTWFNMRA